MRAHSTISAKTFGGQNYTTSNGHVKIGILLHRLLSAVLYVTYTLQNSQHTPLT